MTLKLALSAAALLVASAGSGASDASIELRGRAQQLAVYGPAAGPPVILGSGDLGWAGFVVHVAELLAGKGYRVIGFNTRAYLSSFTAADSALTPADVAADYRQLVEHARGSGSARPVLAGVSEGAGLAVLAATFPEVKMRAAGVLGLGLPDQTALGWRWRDAAVWVTKKAPKEPSFMVRDVIARVSPVPLAEIHSTRDEFLSLEDARSMFARAGEPKRMWVVEAANHRFSNNRPELDRSVLEALQWIASRR